MCQQHHGKQGGFELCVEFLGKIDGMPGIAERNLFVLGARILYQQVGCFEIDRLIVVKHCPHALGCQHLFGLVSAFVGVINQYSGLGSAHGKS